MLSHFLSSPFSIAFVRGAGQSSPCASNQFEQCLTLSARGSRRDGPTQVRARAPAGGATRSALRLSPHICTSIVVWVSFPRPASSWRRHDARQKPAKRRHGAIPSQSGASPAQGDPPSAHWGKGSAPAGGRKKKKDESPKRRGRRRLNEGFRPDRARPFISKSVYSRPGRLRVLTETARSFLIWV